MTSLSFGVSFQLPDPLRQLHHLQFSADEQPVHLVQLRVILFQLSRALLDTLFKSLIQLLQFFLRFSAFFNLFFQDQRLFLKALLCNLPLGHLSFKLDRLKME